MQTVAVSVDTAPTTMPRVGLSRGDVHESPFVPITQELINRFAEVSGDTNPIHLDREYAQRLGLPDTVAHGYLLASRAAGLAYKMGLLVDQSAVFHAANHEYKYFIHPGDQMMIRLEVTSVTELRGGIKKIFLDVKVLNQNRRRIHTYDWVAVLRDQK